MKTKTILYCFLAFIITQAALAQKSIFGIEAGVSLSGHTVFSSAGNQLDWGIVMGHKLIHQSAGFFYQYKLPKQFALRVKAQYFETGSFASAGSYHTQFRYLTLPISFRYQINPKINLGIGSYVSFLTNRNDFITPSIKLTDQYSKNDFGVILSCERIIYKNVSIGLNYFVGLKNIWLNDLHIDQFGTLFKTKVTTQTMQLTLVYRFNKKQ